MVEAIRELPDNATIDDAIERLVFLAKIEIGLAQLDHGEGISHDEVIDEASRPKSAWRTDHGRAQCPRA